MEDQLLLKIIPLIEWVKVNGSRYWLHIVLVLLSWYTFSLNTEYKELISSSSEVISELELKVEDYEGCRTASPYGDPPLRVTFTDERVAFVNFSHLAVPPYSPQWQEIRLSTYEQFSNSLKAAVYLELESVAFGYARTHREQIAQNILKRIEPTLKSLGLEMFQFDLLEFCEVRSR